MFKDLHLFHLKIPFTFSWALVRREKTQFLALNLIVMKKGNVVVVGQGLSTLYGTQFRAIPSLRGGKDVPSMMVWSLTAMLSSIKEFWCVVDNIDGTFRFDSSEGYIVTWVQKPCFFPTNPSLKILALHLLPSSLCNY